MIYSSASGSKCRHAVTVSFYYGITTGEKFWFILRGNH